MFPCQTKGAKIFQKLGNLLKIHGNRRVTSSRLHSENPQISGATVKTLVDTETCRPGFVHPVTGNRPILLQCKNRAVMSSSAFSSCSWTTFSEFLRRVRKIAKSHYMLRHVRLSVRMEQLGSHWTRFWLNLIFGTSTKICRENSSRIKIRQK
jgi:hypothetical protein